MYCIWINLLRLVIISVCKLLIICVVCGLNTLGLVIREDLHLFVISMLTRLRRLSKGLMASFVVFLYFGDYMYFNLVL